MTDAASASQLLDGVDAEDVLAWASREHGTGLTFATGFGPEGCVIIDLIARHRLPIDVFTLDTGVLFPETYALWRQLEQHTGLTIRAVHPALTLDEQAAAHGPALWARDANQCCELRKVIPLRAALAGFTAWISAIRRDQTPTRATAQLVEPDRRFGLTKINPLVAWTSDDVWRYLRTHGVPTNPLHDHGYPSIGCAPCTSPVAVGEDPRAGRWRATTRTECGLHARPAHAADRAPDVLVRPEFAAGLPAQAAPPTTRDLRPTAASAAGFIVWFTGLSGAGKSTLSTALATALGTARPIEILDGDEVRTHLSSGLGFTRADRDTNVHRIGYVARTLARHGVIVITAAISPYAETRRDVRALAEQRGIAVVEVFASASLDALIARDVKGLYKQALAGELTHFTGVSDPYEPPTAPDVEVRSDLETVAQSVAKILAALHARGLIEAPAASPVTTAPREARTAQPIASNATARGDRG